MFYESTDISKLKYVLYVRKSTDDPERQVRSLDDQIAECQRLATHLGIHVVAIITESKSAKKPHLRPQFTQLLKDLKKGKYDAILAWNPDRLARNMMEGGMIIDMIDDEIIKDLKFVTHHFSNDASGKMLLGMAFVLSKQYSDKLSQDVTRGLYRKLMEGKSHIVKHGYIQDEDRYYRPDGANFELIREAWKLKSEGETHDIIAKTLNESGYYRRIKRTDKKVFMDKRTLSKIFKDPFYYGILHQGKHTVDLREEYDFCPAITETDFNNVRQLSIRRIKPLNNHKKSFYPFKAMVICALCGNNMYVSPSTSQSKNKRYLYVRCDNITCPRKKRSMRANILLEYIYKFLDKGLNFTEKEYQQYYKQITTITDEKKAKLDIDIHREQGELKQVTSSILDISSKIIDLPKGQIVREVNERRVDRLAEKKARLEEEIKRLKAQIKDPENEKLNIKDFLNLSKNAATVVKSGSAAVKDQICRIIFLNFTVDEENVLSCQLKEPFVTLLKTRQEHMSRDLRKS